MNGITKDVILAGGTWMEDIMLIKNHQDQGKEEDPTLDRELEGMNPHRDHTGIINQIIQMTKSGIREGLEQGPLQDRHDTQARKMTK